VDEKLKLYTLKKLKKQIEFLRLELQETQYVFEKALTEFNRDFSDTLEKGKPINPQKIQITDQEEKECNTLFRRIATRTHPDKLNNDSEIEERDKKRLEELYKKSNDASEEGDYDTLVKVAGELGFEDVTENEFYLEKSVSKLSDKIKHLQTTYAWVWYHEKNTDRKENLKQHIKRTYA
jgi:50S ribosomal subunit-associated GTPase HflX